MYDTFLHKNWFLFFVILNLDNSDLSKPKSKLQPDFNPLQDSSGFW